MVNNSDNDFDRPVLSSFNVSPTSVDISSGTVTLTATINASDTSGIQSPTRVSILIIIAIHFLELAGL